MFYEDLVMQYSVRVLILTIIFNFIATNALAQTATEFDADGTSDIVAVTIQGDETLNWAVAQSDSNYATTQYGILGKNGSHLIPGYWTSTTVQDIGITTLNTDIKLITWTIQRPTGSQHALVLGKKGNDVIAGGDYDNNGFFDAAVATANGKVTIFTNPFASVVGGPASTAYELKFPKKNARRGEPMFLRRGGKDLIGYITYRKVKAGFKVRLNFKDLEGNKFKKRLKGFEQKKSSEIFPIKSPGGDDYIVFVRKAKDTKIVTIRDLRGSIVNRGKHLGGEVVLVGDFDPSDPGQEVGVEVSTQVQVSNPTSKVSSLLSDPGGVLADDVNIKQLGKRKKSGGSGGGSDGGSDNGGGTGNFNSVCRSVRGVSTGFLWKPDSDVSDNRGGKPVVLLQGGFKFGGSSVNIYAKNGTKVCNFTFKQGQPGINGGADHYYSGWIGGCSLTGGQIASKARSVSGSATVYVQTGSGRCVGPINNPDGRSGGIF